MSRYAVMRAIPSAPSHPVSSRSRKNGTRQYQCQTSPSRQGLASQQRPYSHDQISREPLTSKCRLNHCLNQQRQQRRMVLQLTAQKT